LQNHDKPAHQIWQSEIVQFMKTKLCLGIILLTATLLSAQTNNLTALLQQGLFEEQANRNLDAAIADYQSLASQFDQDRQLAATGVFRLGECYRAQGRTNEAAAEYQRIIRNFSDQQTLATLSRQNLAGMGLVSPTASVPQKGPAENADLQLWTKLSAMPRNELEQVLPTVIPDSALQSLLQQRSDAQFRRAAVTVDYSTNSVEVQRIDAQLKELNSAIDGRINGILQGLKLRAEVSPNAPLPATIETAGPASSDEDQEIQRIQRMIQNSPDLIDAAVDGSTPLAKAAFNGWLKVAAYLLDHGANVNTTAPSVHWTKELDNGPITPLLASVDAGNKAMTQFLIDRGADLNSKVRNGRTSLHFAAKKGFQAVVDVLLASHADVNVQDGGGAPPLFAAIDGGQLKIVQALLAAGGNPNLKDNQGRTALGDAIGSSPEILQALLKAGADPNIVDNNGRTPLSYAAERETTDVVKLLLAAKADPNGGNLDTPLLAAIQHRNLASAELLLQAGANPNAKILITWSVLIGNMFYGEGGTQPVTPLHLAITQDQLPMVQLLLKYKADPNDAQTDGPLLFAALPYTNILTALLDAGATADVRQSSGTTPLDVAVKENETTAARLLLKHKADPNDAALDRRPILFAALSNTNIIEALLDAGANVESHETSDINGDHPAYTPLAAAAWQRETASINLLLKRGARPNVRDAAGRTPLHWAVSAYHSDLTDQNREIVQSLLDHGADPNIRDTRGDTPLDWVKRRLSASSGQNLPGPGRPIRFGGGSPERVPDQKAEAEQIIALLHQHGALDHLPAWDRIIVSRPSANFSYPIFRSSTNDWNHFTLLEFLADIYEGSATCSVDQGNGNMNNYYLSAMLPFPDPARVTIVRPDAHSTNQTRLLVNLLNETNGIDCSKDVPLLFGDVVEVPERDHPLGEQASGLTGAQDGSLRNCLAATVKLVAHGQAAELNFWRVRSDVSRGWFGESIKQVLSQPDAQKLLLSSSDLSRVKVTRQDPKTGKSREWILDCSDLSTAPNASPHRNGGPSSFAMRLAAAAPPGSPLNASGNNSEVDLQDFWLENGDVIEVPEK
jgi:ankyrin repeat protein